MRDLLVSDLLVRDLVRKDPVITVIRSHSHEIE